MKATKKIVGAACALVAAVALSAGSTFAWFSSSGKVSAEGMKVQTVVPTNLYISTGIQTSADNIKDQVADFKETTAKVLEPSMVKSASEGTLTMQIPDTWTKKPTPTTKGEPATYKDVATVTVSGSTAAAGAEEGKNYVAVYSMSIVNKAGDNVANIDLDATVTVTYDTESEDATNPTTIKFLKCGFIVGKTWTAITGDWTDSYQTTFSSVVSSLARNTIQTLALVVWYDGDDADCIAQNAVSVEGMSISIEFTNASA